MQELENVSPPPPPTTYDDLTRKADYLVDNHVEEVCLVEDVYLYVDALGGEVRFEANKAYEENSSVGSECGDAMEHALALLA